MVVYVNVGKKKNEKDGKINSDFGRLRENGKQL